MASLSGVRSTAAIKIASTWGTAVAVGANNKLKSEITANFNVEELVTREIGSGNSMVSNATRGNFKPVFNLAMDGTYHPQMPVIIAQMMGTSGAPSNGGAGDYTHTITYNTTLNAKYLTLAYETATAEVIEAPTCACRSFTISAEDAPGILNFEAELIGNTALVTGFTNNNAAIIAATLTDTEVIAYADVDLFRINAQSAGSLSGSDNLAITSYSLTLTRPQEIFGEIKGSAGNSAPVEAGLFEGELTVTLKDHADHTWEDIWSAETAYKCSLNIQGTQIGGGGNKAITVFLPSMKLVQEPQYALTEPGVNPTTLTFRCLQASANPTGMSSTLPYFTFVNTLSTSLLA